jgi:hypothetical protein
MRIYLGLACGVTDMRRGFDASSMLVQEVLMQDPFSGHLFAFRGRRNEGPLHRSPGTEAVTLTPAQPIRRVAIEHGGRRYACMRARHADRPTAGRFGLAIARREHGHWRIIAMDYHARNYVRSD